MVSELPLVIIKLFFELCFISRTFNLFVIGQKEIIWPHLNERYKHGERAQAYARHLCNVVNACTQCKIYFSEFQTISYNVQAVKI